MINEKKLKSANIFLNISIVITIITVILCELCTVLVAQPLPDNIENFVLANTYWDEMVLCFMFIFQTLNFLATKTDIDDCVSNNLYIEFSKVKRRRFLKSLRRSLICSAIYLLCLALFIVVMITNIQELLFLVAGISLITSYAASN